MSFSGSVLAITLGLALGLPASGAQAQSAGDLDALIEERTADFDHFRELLNDPDLDRATAAMEVLLDSGDPALQEMALEFGIFSPDPGLRRKALEGFFNAGPSLGVTFDPTGLEGDFKVSMNQVGGTVGLDGKGFATFLLGEFDPAQNCWKDARSHRCLISLTEASVAVAFYGEWGQGQLQDDGTVSGVANLSRMDSIPFSFPVTF